MKNPPEFNLGADTILCEDEILFLEVNSAESTFLWSDSTSDSELTVFSAGDYYVETENICGKYSDTIRIDYEYCGEIYIPNIITPNGDGINDVFYIKGLEKQIWNLKIYSRWGNTVFSSLDYQNDWEAKGLNEGVYFYLLYSTNNPQRFEGFLHIEK